MGGRGVGGLNEVEERRGGWVGGWVGGWAGGWKDVPRALAGLRPLPILLLPPTLGLEEEEEEEEEATERPPEREWVEDGGGRGGGGGSVGGGREGNMLAAAVGSLVLWLLIIPLGEGGWEKGLVVALRPSSFFLLLFLFSHSLSTCCSATARL